MRLIDLQRVQHRTRFRGRWIVKDLAQLAYSAPRDYRELQPQVGIFQGLSGRREARPQDKRLLRSVLREAMVHGTETGTATMRVGLVVRQFNPQRRRRRTLDLRTGRAHRRRRARGSRRGAAIRAGRARAADRAARRAARCIRRTPLPWLSTRHCANCDLDLVHDMGFGWQFDIFQPHFGVGPGPVRSQVAVDAPLDAHRARGTGGRFAALAQQRTASLATIRRSPPLGHRCCRSLWPATWSARMAGRWSGRD